MERGGSCEKKGTTPWAGEIVTEVAVTEAAHGWAGEET